MRYPFPAFRTITMNLLLSIIGRPLLRKAVEAYAAAARMLFDAFRETFGKRHSLYFLLAPRDGTIFINVVGSSSVCALEDAMPLFTPVSKK